MDEILNQMNDPSLIYLYIVGAFIFIAKMVFIFRAWRKEGQRY